jgi:ribulose-phosphate 3-epimerase
MILVSPSLLAADFGHLNEEILKVKKAGADSLHLDVMDGRFVPNITFGMPVISSIRRATDLLFDVHLMIEDPGRYINEFSSAGADSLTIHYESTSDPAALIQEMQALEVKPAMAISPDTPPDVLFPYLADLQMVLVMTVYPGFGGQKFMPEMLEKIRILRRKINELHLSTDIQVDGGISASNVGLVTEAGANVIVAGSAIFGAKSPKLAISDMRLAADRHPFKG